MSHVKNFMIVGGGLAPSRPRRNCARTVTMGPSPAESFPLPYRFGKGRDADISAKKHTVGRNLTILTHQWAIQCYI